MKLSICVPIYNCDMGLLLSQLRAQMDDVSASVELLVIDDASDAKFQTINNSYQHFTDYWENSPVNLGRSKIRNRFLSVAKGEYLLFLDCDALIDNPKFLNNYISSLISHPNKDVFYGSFKINSNYAGTLRNIYSVEREIPRKSNLESFEALQTINFVIKKACFEAIHFDESLTQYGYEDFLFTKNLEKEGKSILIIDNPVIHNDTTENDIFLEKTKLGVASLYKLSLLEENRALLRSIKLYRAAELISKFKMAYLARIGYGLFKSKIVANLRSKNPKMRYYDFYKLGELLKCMK